MGYNHINNLGNVSQFYESSKLTLHYIDNLIEKLKIYVNEIPENVIFSVLPVLRWQYSTGEYRSLSLSDSIKIIRSISLNLLAEKILWDIAETLLEYDLRDADLELYLMSRPWLNVDEFDLDGKNLDDEFNGVLGKKLSALSKSSLKDSPDFVANLSNLKKNYLYKDVFMDNYGDPVLDKNLNLIGYKLNSNKFITIETYYNENNLLCNKVSIRDLDQSKLSFRGDTLVSWVDIRTEFGFVRELKNNKYYYNKNNILLNVETSYTCAQFPLLKKDNKLNNKIGTIDFETFGSNLGMGHHKVYAGGWAVEGETKLFYINKIESSDQLVNIIFFNIFMNPKLNGYTFYAHNLGRFDSVFILKSLVLLNNVEVIPLWKENAIISLTITYQDFKITLLDSLQLFKGSLDSVLKSFNCETQKGQFPYSFVNKDNLNYIGDKPSKNFFNNISEKEYKNIETKWDLRKETLNYLKSDIEGLLEALTKFNDSIYNKYQLNITKFKTLPGLALAAYRSSYIPSHLIKEFKMVKGELEREIRKSYFGGNVDVFINRITTGYHYDLNSQYPAAMMKDMPVGEPNLSLETDLSKIFGFVYAEFTCPDENILQVLLYNIEIR